MVSMDTPLSQGGAEGMPQRVGVPGRNPGDLAVVAEDPAHPGLGQWLPPVRALGHDEQPGAGRLGPLCEQVGLDHRTDVGIQRHPPFPVALSGDLHPPAADVHVGDTQPEHFGAAQPAIQSSVARGDAVTA